MKKLAFLFILLFAALCLASCAGGTCEHEFGEWETLVKASCTAPKVEQRTCTLCEHTEVKKTETKGHKYSEWKLSGDLVDGSCEGSVFAATCAVCNEITFKRGDASNHDFETVTVEPTCTSGGYDEKTCKTCGKVEKANETGILPHNFEKTYSADASHHWFACSVCGEQKNKTQHTKGNDGKCSVCGMQLPTEGVIYEISANGTYAKVKGYAGTATQILIASKYQGLPVKNIYDEAFKYNKSITSVIIPDSVISIGSSAFARCNALESVTIPDSVTSIGDDAFYYCTSLESVTIPDSVTSIGDYAFGYCSALKSVTIPGSVTSIGSYAFYNCSALKSVTIPDSVTSIGEGVFYDCNSALYTTYELGTYVGDKENPYAVLIEITNKDLSTYTIHENTKHIAYGVFKSCERLTSIIIPDSVTSIGSSAFYDCDALESVTIGDGVTLIGSEAFAWCPALRSVIFEDTSTWYRIDYYNDNAYKKWQNKKGGTEIDVIDPEDAAYSLRNHFDYYWYKL